MSPPTRPAKRTIPSHTSLTIEQFGEYICPGVWDKPELRRWPPDVFAVAASLLLKSGAYSCAVSEWKRDKPLGKWVEWISEIGQHWRTHLSSPGTEVRRWHDTLTTKQARKVPVLEISKHKDIYNALLHLCAAADEACRGVGFGMSQKDPFLVIASEKLYLSGERLGVSTLCERVDHAAVRVLPKLHTPQKGITIRSLTHNLALCPAGDVNVRWAENPCVHNHYFNILLAPWPLMTTPADFQSVDSKKAELQQMPREFGFFEYNPTHEGKAEEDLVRNLDLLIKQAQKMVTKVHGVILPECALTSEQHRRISASLMKKNIFLISGVRSDAPPKGKAGINCLRVDVPLDSYVASHEQSKHHRWQLDKRQIIQYGLGSSLDIRSNWWEHITVGDRTLYFVVLDDWLTICPLICEDLARQDPVSDVVRAVGPNLVVAILMDGPQIPARWPAYYATVLADDPGSSVLTLTSLGMCALSRPPGKPRSRAIALWKDVKSGEAISIDLPEDAHGILLSLSRQFEKEWAADGRDDRGATGYPILSGIHPISLKDSQSQ